MGVVVERFDVFLVRLDPAQGVEIQKTRPCLVISPNEMNTLADRRTARASVIQLKFRAAQHRPEKLFHPGLQ
jgi:mRNA-degrading endonuclease toxin of MazEF toxin-antitoxin module